MRDKYMWLRYAIIALYLGIIPWIVTVYKLFGARA